MLFALALRENRLLLTEDKDSRSRLSSRTHGAGVVLMRTDFEKSRAEMLQLEAAIARYGEGLFGHYTVIEEGRIRSRRLSRAS